VGRAAYVVERGGQELKLCTRCTLSRDEEKARLFTEDEIPEFVKLDATAKGRNAEADAWDAIGQMFGGIETILGYKAKDLPLWRIH
jgi:hypothetical protein